MKIGYNCQEKPKHGLVHHVHCQSTILLSSIFSNVKMGPQDIIVCESHKLGFEVGTITHNIVVDETHLKVHGEKIARAGHACDCM